MRLYLHTQATLLLLGQRLQELSPRGPYTQAQVVTAAQAVGDETWISLQSLAFHLSGASTEQEIPWGDGHH